MTIQQKKVSKKKINKKQTNNKGESTKLQFKQSIKDSFSLRRAALTSGTPYYTTIAGANAITEAIKSLKNSKFEVLALQDIN